MSEELEMRRLQDYETQQTLAKAIEEDDQIVFKSFLTSQQQQLSIFKAGYSFKGDAFLYAVANGATKIMNYIIENKQFDVKATCSIWFSDEYDLGTEIHYSNMDWLHVMIEYHPELIPDYIQKLVVPKSSKCNFYRSEGYDKFTFVADHIQFAVLCENEPFEEMEEVLKTLPDEGDTSFQQLWSHLNKKQQQTKQLWKKYFEDRSTSSAEASTTTTTSQQ